MNDNENKNRRILIIDDNEAIHKDFRAILEDGNSDSANIDAEKSVLFGETEVSPKKLTFEIDSAFQGEEGLEKIRQALLEGRPYAMAFVDVRMPPGWDGIETVQKIWMEYPDLQVVICTAYSDYSWQDIIDELGETEKLLILKKPFDNVEVYQLASAMTQKWFLCQQAKLRYEELERIVKQKTYQLQITNDELESSNKELTAALREAENAEKIKSEFLANMSHEIRTPLNSVIGFSDILFEEELSNEQKEYVGFIRKSSGSLMHIINDILDFSKIEAGRLDLDIVDVDIHQMLNDLEGMFQIQAEEKGIDFKVLIENHFPDVVRTDPGRLRQCLLNLISNAIKFTNKGYVNVSASLDHESHDKPVLLFEVQDTGIGIEPANQKVIFESFSQVDYSASREYAGTGLGLAITKKLVELLGGDISLTSQVGQGSLFRFQIPVEADIRQKDVPDVWPDQNGASAEHKLPDDISGTILVAEDVFTNQDIVKQLLATVGVKVTITANGQEVMDQLSSKAFDVILMDMEVPDMSGGELVKRIRSFGCQTPVIALIDDSEQDSKQNCLDLGCNDVLAKPIEQKQLVPLIAKYLSSKQTASSGASK